MPKLVRLYITHVAIGFAISAAFTLALVFLDVAGLKGLVLGSSDGILGAFLIFFFNGLVFGGVQFAIAVMRMRDDGKPRGGKRLPLRLQPARADVRAGAKRRARTQPFG